VTPWAAGNVLPGASCTIRVSFRPTATGARAGMLTVAEDAPGGEHTVSLTGEGTMPAVSLSPKGLEFGTQKVGTTSASQVVTLTNTGVVPLSIEGIATSGDFAQRNDCGGSLAAGTSCTISVTFAPTAGGDQAGALTISDDAADSPQLVSLKGEGRGRR